MTDGSLLARATSSDRGRLHDRADEDADVRVASYSVVHLVAGETTKDLVIPQVVTHMVQQAETGGPLRPTQVVVAFLEPARVAARYTVRAHVRRIRSFAPSLRVALVPYVSRLALGTNAAVLGHLVRRVAGDENVVFHCRGEWAVLWAAALARHVRHAGIVADIRGAWPEESLAMRGFLSPEAADRDSVRDFHLQLATVQQALARAAQVLTVSPGMMDWLRELGVSEDRLHYVPSCVPRLTYSPQVRAAMRRELGFERELVYCFLGSAYSYRTIGDDLAPFLRATFERHGDARLLMLTDEPERLRTLLAAEGIPDERAVVARAPHDQVWRYLCAADCGCILKGPGRLNRTWQPVKLAEYLAAGLPVVVSRGVGEVDQLISGAGAGLAVDFTAGDEAFETEADRVHHALATGGDRMRERALQLCSDHFLWSRYIDRVRDAYQRALQA